ncbi:PIN domain-containing protein [Lysobacter sp. A421]
MHRIVLDTNVCLDLLLFNDPRVRALKAALRAGDVIAVGNHDCRAEWLRVLRYPVLKLDEDRCTTMVAAFDAVTTPLHAMEAATGSRPDVALPRCSDPDDQKFLQLACDSGARWLLSRDRHLLSLARRCKREGLFEITTPDQWIAPDNPIQERPVRALTTRTGTTA